MNDLAALTRLRLLFRHRREPSCERALLSALWTLALLGTGVMCVVSVSLGVYVRYAQRSPDVAVSSAGVDTLSREQLSEAVKAFDARESAYQEVLQEGVMVRDPSIPLR